MRLLALGQTSSCCKRLGIGMPVAGLLGVPNFVAGDASSVPRLRVLVVRVVLAKRALPCFGALMRDLHASKSICLRPLSTGFAVGFLATSLWFPFTDLLTQPTPICCLWSFAPASELNRPTFLLGDFNWKGRYQQLLGPAGARLFPVVPTVLRSQASPSRGLVLGDVDVSLALVNTSALPGIPHHKAVCFGGAVLPTGFPEPACRTRFRRTSAFVIGHCLKRFRMIVLAFYVRLRMMCLLALVLIWLLGVGTDGPKPAVRLPPAWVWPPNRVLLSGLKVLTRPFGRVAKAPAFARLSLWL